MPQIIEIDPPQLRESLKAEEGHYIIHGGYAILVIQMVFITIKHTF